MNLPALDHSMRVGRLAQVTQLAGTYDSKTDQTAQPDQRIETAEQFGAAVGPELTTRDPKLTGGTAQRPHPDVQVVGASLGFVHARPSDGASPP
jgi:hypothetical protein